MIPYLPSRTPSRDPRQGVRREADPEGDSNPYSQHSELLQPSEVILMDPCDVVAIELPGRERGERKW